MTICTPERTPIGILAQGEEEYLAAIRSIDVDFFDAVHLDEEYPAVQAGSSIETAAHAARKAARIHGIPVIQEVYSIHFNALCGLPGPYANDAEKVLDTTGLLSMLEGLNRTGSYVTSAALCDTRGITVGTTSRVDFNVAHEPIKGLRAGWMQIIEPQNDYRGIIPAPKDTPKQLWSDNHSRLSEYIRWCQERVVYLTGPHAAGKTEAAKLLEYAYGYPYFDLGPAIRQAHTKQLGKVSLEVWIKEQEEIFGSDFTDSLLTDLVRKRRGEQEHPAGFTIVGSRSTGGLKYLNQSLLPSSSLHIHVSAEESLLYDRYTTREQRELTKEEFADKLNRDAKMGLDDLASTADIIIQNSGDKVAFQRRVGQAINDWELILPSNDLFYIPQD